MVVKPRLPSLRVPVASLNELASKALALLLEARLKGADVDLTAGGFKYRVSLRIERGRRAEDAGGWGKH